MPKKTLLCEDNFPVIKQTILQICEDLKRSGINNNIEIDSFVLNECFLAAQSSIKFYNLGETEVSHYKEISHVSYWINRLKPIHVDNPFNLARRLAELGFDAFGALTGMGIAEKDFGDDAEFPINEHVAFYLARDVIKACQLEEISHLSATAQKTYKKKIKDVDEKIESMKKTLLISMRYHNHSARSFALMIETLTRLDKV